MFNTKEGCYGAPKRPEGMTLTIIIHLTHNHCAKCCRLQRSLVRHLVFACSLYAGSVFLNHSKSVLIWPVVSLICNHFLKRLKRMFSFTLQTGNSHNVVTRPRCSSGCTTCTKLNQPLTLVLILFLPRSSAGVCAERETERIEMMQGMPFSYKTLFI